MRYGRKWVLENSKNKRVLNLFAYTCGFSVSAIAGNAQSVVNLDMAKAALSKGRVNHQLNEHDLRKVRFLGYDLFKSWGKVKKFGPYDLIIIDPPEFIDSDSEASLKKFIICFRWQIRAKFN